jgi:purine-binding chemotaxis protein CheW
MFGFRQFSEEELNILRQRAERVARATKDDSGSEVIGALTIVVGNEVYAVPIDVPSYVSGISNIRGHIVPVLNLSYLLNGDFSADEEARMLIVASNGDVTMAFQADKVGDVLNIFSREVNLPPGGAGQQVNYIQGILSDGAALLNIRAILSDPALVVSAAAE